MRLIKQILRAIWVVCLAFCLLCMDTSDVQAGFFKRLKERRQSNTINCQSTATTATNTPTTTNQTPIQLMIHQQPLGQPQPLTTEACSNGSCSNSSSTTRRGLFFRR